ncbi:hypothetical protein TeGR_g12453 [Tetraparma gracilis]|uniref:PIH1D1/2/3 CS-like domain-containing protein n=1 Tax=Tetraparma gracilis TaxID=2962635 RepID=A0ABQ6NCS4_9STRA|nr:hypothetical protein TeGR_g12453 [Tetraparma gracilis]
MAALKDSLNYSKFEFVDSDDEDYVEKKIMQNALNPDSNPTSVRNAAAHSMAKKGQNVHQIDATLSKTKSAMQSQIDELNEQMKKLEDQQNKLSSIDNPDDAFKFMQESGMTEEDMEKLVKAAGMNLDEKGAQDVVGDVVNNTIGGGGSASKEAVDAVVGSVEDVAAQIGELASSDPVDSDDEEENTPPSSTASSDPPPASALDPDTKKKMDNFSRAISQQKEQREMYEKAEEAQEEQAMVPSHTLDYTDSAFSLEVKMPLASSMKTIDLQVSRTQLKLGSEEGYTLELDWRHPIDDESIKAKFSKKTKTLTLSGLLE